MRLPETNTAPLSTGGRVTGSTTRARSNMDQSGLEQSGAGQPGAPLPAPPPSDFRFLALAFHPGGFGMFAGFVFALTFANLLLDFLGDEVNRGVKVAFSILRKEVGTGYGKPHGAAELSFGRFSMVVLECYARINGETVKVVKLVDAGDDVVLDRFGQGQIVRRKNQFHGGMMVSTGRKIQSKSFVYFAQSFLSVVTGIQTADAWRTCRAAPATSR